MIKQLLSSMAYREISPGCWLKPVGLHCFTFREDTLVWANLYRANDTGAILKYEWHRLNGKEEPEDALRMLKTWEAYSPISKAPDAQSQFQLEPLPEYVFDG